MREYGGVHLGIIASVNQRGFGSRSKYDDDSHIVMVKNILHRLKPGIGAVGPEGDE